jgi:hypothetical protein
MNNLDNLKTWCQSMIQLYPELRTEITETYFLAQDEVDSGEPEQSECEKALDYIEELIDA